MVFLLTVKRPMIQVLPSKGCKKTAALMRLLHCTCKLKRVYGCLYFYLAVLIFACCSPVKYLSAVLYILHKVAIKMKTLTCDDHEQLVKVFNVRMARNTHVLL